MRSTKLTLLTIASLISATSPAFAASQGPLRASASAPLSATAPASRLSLRAGKSMKGSSQLAGGNGLGIAMLVVVLGGAAWAAYEMINGDDTPASP